jgi:cytochrome c-type biogenesis protein CcmH
VTAEAGRSLRSGKARGSALTLGLAALVAAGAVVLAASRGPSTPATFEGRVQQVASTLRCVVCQNLSVADSPAPLAQQMRAEIARRLRAGQTSAQVQDYFVGRYGQWILLAPRARGLGVLPWAAPAAALVAGALALATVLRRRQTAPEVVTDLERDRIRHELAALEEPE